MQGGMLSESPVGMCTGGGPSTPQPSSNDSWANQLPRSLLKELGLNHERCSPTVKRLWGLDCAACEERQSLCPACVDEQLCDACMEDDAEAECVCGYGANHLSQCLSLSANVCKFP